MHQGDYSMTADLPKGWLNRITNTNCHGKGATRDKDRENMQQKRRIGKRVKRVYVMLWLHTGLNYRYCDHDG